MELEPVERGCAQSALNPNSRRKMPVQQVRNRHRKQPGAAPALIQLATLAVQIQESCHPFLLGVLATGLSVIRAQSPDSEWLVFLEVASILGRLPQRMGCCY